MSKLLLGNLDRLEVGVAIALSPDGLVNATDLQAELGLAQSRVRSQLVTMTNAGLLVALPRAGFKRWYERQESTFWRSCLDLYEEWRG